MKYPQLFIDQYASFDPHYTFFQLDQLQQLEFHDCIEMDVFFYEKSSSGGV